MKQFLLRKLFANQPARQYLTLGLREDDICEKAFIQTDDNSWMDVSTHQFVLCQNPFIVGVWSNNKSYLRKNKARMKITDTRLHDLVTLQLQKLETVEFQHGNLILYKLQNSKFTFIPWMHQKLLVSYFYLQRKSHVTFYELNSFCATYTYPRKVILTCFGYADDYNLFPMDLQGHIKEDGIYVLGLRNSNVTLKKILSAGKVVVCDVASTEKDRLVALGKHHSSQPPSIDDLPFTFEATSLFKMLVPDIVSNYSELEIIHHLNMGSHTLMIGRILNERLGKVSLSTLHQMHIVAAIKKINNYNVI